MSKEDCIFSTNKLKGRMTELGIHQFEVANKLDISKASLSAKLNGKVFFTAYEIYQLINILNITDHYKEYFFTTKV